MEEILFRFIDMLFYVLVRCLVKVVGKIMFLYFVLGNICRLMIRFFYMKIVLRKFWDLRFNFKF